MRTLTFIAFLFAAAPGAALAHGGDAHSGGPQWTFDPCVVALLLISGVLYAVGAATVWWRAGFGRGVRTWQAACYGCGWLMLAGALISPLHWLGEHLFTFHMIEHEIIMAAAAPLIVVARPMGAMLWALPRRARMALGDLTKTSALRTLWTSISAGSTATLMQGVAIWFWHAPVFFDAAVTNDGVHRLQHLSFLLTAILFWWAVLRRGDYGASAWHLFVTMMHTGALGALMALSPRVLYAAQTAEAARWGLTPLQDQQLAGLIMWVPAGTVYAGAALWMAGNWIRRSSARQSDAAGIF